jgi:tartrate dehydratase alpha subunit/fumarate hydratase class I-like protein
MNIENIVDGVVQLIKKAETELPDDVIQALKKAYKV